MGASINAYWSGITEEQLESQPGFYNDDKAWGDFMAERESEPEVLEAIRKLNAAALLSHTTEGMADEEVMWVSPSELRNAAKNLREAIQAKRPETEIILETYEANANEVDPIADEIIQDLTDIEAIADWAESEGAKQMTLEVNW
jgi:ABC-type Zn uptake system ZnuABC Zn-binding protein ZnuA